MASETLADIAEYARTARCHTEDAHVLGYLDQIEKLAESALSAPPRNCDVGTAEEQAQRFDDDLVPSCKADEYCRCKDAARCFAQWSQMPYEAKEGGAE